MRRDPLRPRGQQRVQLILNTAMHLIEKNGFETLTTNAIADAAGISIGSLYQYFPDKEAIASALVHQYMQQVQQLIMDCFSDDALDKSVNDLLESLYYPYINLHANWQPALKLLLIYPGICPGIATVINDEGDVFMGRLVQFVRKRTHEKLSVEEARVFIITSMSLLKALIPMLSDAKDPGFRQHLIDEYRGVILNYWQPILA